MSAPSVSVSMISNTQALVLGVAALAVAWYIKNRADEAGAGIKDILFGPKLPPKINLTPAATVSREEYIKLGYGEIDKNGVFKITPAGNAYIARMAAKDDMIQISDIEKGGVPLRTPELTGISGGAGGVVGKWPWQ